MWQVTFSPVLYFALCLLLWQGILSVVPVCVLQPYLRSPFGSEWPAVLLSVDAARCPTLQKAGGLVSGHLCKLFGCDAIALEPFRCWAFRYLDIVVGMKATRKAADRKILLSAVSASSPGGIKLRCSLNSSLPLFGLGLLVCSMSGEYFLSWNTCRSGMAT